MFSRVKNFFSASTKPETVARPGRPDISKIHHTKVEREPALSGLCDKSRPNNADIFRK